MFTEIDDFYQSMRTRLEQARRERSELDEILAFYAKVLDIQQEAQGETTIPEIELTEEHTKLKIEEGFPLIDREHFPVDRISSEGLFRKLCQMSSAENPVLARAGKILLEKIDRGDLDFTRLYGGILKNESKDTEKLSDDLEVPFPVLQALAKLSLQPSLLAIAARVGKKTPMQNWHQGYCPVCGGLPSMAALVDEEGKREGLCSFCGYIWRLPRLLCPFCKTDKQEDLHYFYGEGEDNYRVYVCEQCKGYIKVVDTREGGDAKALAVEDIVTSHLDLVAEEEGYQRKAPRFWGI